MAIVELFPRTPQKPAGALAQFEAWWATYPEKVGKGAARAAFLRAIRLATPEELMAGVVHYAANKPAARAWCHPTTWLNQERWLDQPAGGTSPTRPKPYVFILEGSDEYAAWCQSGAKMARYKNPHNTAQIGMHVPQRWPIRPNMLNDGLNDQDHRPARLTVVSNNRVP